MKNLIISIFFVVQSLHLFSQFQFAKLDSVFQILENQNQCTGSFSIAKKGKIIYQKSIGFADIDQKIKNNENTSYGIGSITKTFTATLLFETMEKSHQLPNGSILTLDTKLSEFYPQIPNSNRINIAMLLSHKSGLYNITDASDYLEWNQNYQSKEKLLEKIINLPADFEPGTQMSYSNTNYIILGWILEDIHKSTFANLIQKLCVEKLKYRKTKVGQTNVFPDANSYEKKENKWIKTSRTDASIPFSAGNMISTPNELNLFIYQLLSGKIVNKKTLAVMKETENNVGKGLFKVPFYENTGYGHTGGIDGYQSASFFFDNQEISISLCLNGNDMTMNDILIYMLSAVYNKAFDLPQILKNNELDKDLINKITKTYTNSDLQFDIKIFEKNGFLFAQGTNQPEFPLTYVGENQFTFEKAAVKIQFDKDYKSFTLFQNGQKFKFLLK